MAPRTYRLLPWILSVILTASPLITQNAWAQTQRIVLLDRDQAIERARQRLLAEPTVDDIRLSGSTLLLKVPSPVSFVPPVEPQSKPGGKNKGIILGIIGGAVVATIIILLLGGDDDPEVRTPAPAPQVTILAPGTPRVNTPTNP
jgi:hypothetical protein